MDKFSELSMTTKIERLSRILIPIAVSFLFAFTYKSMGKNDFKEFISFGAISLFTNMTISFLYCFGIKTNKDSFLESAEGSYFTAIFTMLLLIVPYTILYVIATIISSGFKFPFN